jgi:hypothetical protein
VFMLRVTGVRLRFQDRHARSCYATTKLACVLAEDGGSRSNGCVCVIDTTPRSLSPIQVAALEALARHTMALLEMRRTIQTYEQAGTPERN